MSGAAAANIGDLKSAHATQKNERIARMRRKYQNGPAYISIERAKYYTESWKETEGKGIPLTVRVALAMKNVYEKMTHYLDPDDRIAGYWCEFFLGIPIDIERGVFNSVLEAELNKKSMLKFRARTMVKATSYMVRKKKLGEFIRNQKMTKSAGAAPLNMNLKTMPEREINPYQIKKDDEKYLLKRNISLNDSFRSGKERHWSTASSGRRSKPAFIRKTCTILCLPFRAIRPGRF